MKVYYLSLCRSLFGFYVAFLAPDEDTVRKHACEYYGRLWCSVYEERPKTTHPGFRGILREDDPIVLFESSWE